MRTFIAININEDLKEILKNTINKLKNIYENVRWVNFTNTHLTLTFLGEVEEQKVEEINHILEKILANEKSFIAYIGNATGFPNKNNARVICLEINDPKGEISKLKKKIDNEIEKCHLLIPDKKEFSPHLTLARVKHGTVKIKDYTELQNKKFEIKEISLYESILTKEGPIYNKLHNYSLKK